MDLDAILERNRGYVRRREASALPPAETIRLAVVACYDPRLDGMLLPALGLAPGDAFLLRTAGTLLQPGSSSMRSLGLAVFMFGVGEVIVLGHTSCRMARFDTSRFIESFRDRGVDRAAFGDQDLRAWAGTIPDPRRGVAISVANILAAPFFPRDLAIAGCVLDDATGAIEVVVKPGERPVVGGGASFVEPIPQAAAPAAVAPPAHAPAAQSAVRPAEAAGEPAAAAADPLLDAVDSLADVLRGRARWRDELHKLRQDIDREGSPIAKLRIVERFVRAAASDSNEVRGAFERLRHEAATGGRGIDFEELFGRILRRAGRP
jgi:carbonic anhydrase